LTQTARVMAACQLLKAHGFEDIAGLLAKTELVERRDAARVRGRRVRGVKVVHARTGREIVIDEKLVRAALRQARDAARQLVRV